MVTQNLLRTYEGNSIFSDKKNGFLTFLDRNNCLKQIKIETRAHLFLLANLVPWFRTLKPEMHQNGQKPIQWI